MSRPRVRSMTAIATFAGLLAACNLIAGLGEDFRVDSKTTIENEGGGTDAPTSEAAVDGTTTNDVVVITEAAAAKFCTTADTGINDLGYCWDFEDAGVTSPFGWDMARLEDADASVRVLPGSGLAGSTGLEVFLEQKDGSPSSNVWLAKVIPYGVKAPRDLAHIEVEFDFSLVAQQGMYSAGVGELTFPSAGGPQTEFGVSTYEFGSTVSRLDFAGNQFGIQPNAWYHAVIVLDRTDGATTFHETVTVNEVGKTTVTVVERIDSGIDPGTGPTEIRLGVFGTDPAKGFVHVRFDHLIVRRH